MLIQARRLPFPGSDLHAVKRLAPWAAACLALASCGGSPINDDPNAVVADQLEVRLDQARPSVQVNKLSDQTTADTITISGSASDDRAVSRVTWTNGAQGAGLAILSSDGANVTWTIQQLPLALGSNEVVVRVYDRAGQYVASVHHVQRVASTEASASSAAATANPGTPAATTTPETPADTSPPVTVTSPAPAPSAVATTSAPAPAPNLWPSSSGDASINVFYSGHSLTDNPLPDNVEAIATSLGKASRWNQQNVIGSPVRVRVKGMDTQASGFPGYSLGKNRDGANMNVASELRQPQTLGGQRYDALVITENHNLPLEGEDTVRYTRHVHERLIEGNPGAKSYFYQAWQSIPDKSNARPWIEHERAMAPAWQCVVSRINRSLAHEQRSDRMAYLPAGPALATLVESATQGVVEGISGANTAETLSRLFVDDVHLTSLGAYYISLVSYAVLFKSSPVGAWAPSSVSAVQARSLQDVAWQTVSSHLANANLPELESCSSLMVQSLCARQFSYIQLPQAIPGCRTSFAANDSRNPFWFDASQDASYWFAAP